MKTKDREKVIRHFKKGLNIAKKNNSKWVTIFRKDVRTVLSLINNEETPHKIDLSEEMKNFLAEQTAQERLNFIADLVFDWDGFVTADNLGGLLNEVYTYSLYPTKK